MNRSGIAVREAAMYFDAAPENLIVIYDDIDLPIGSIRIRKSGGAGTHGSVNQCFLNNKDYTLYIIKNKIIVFNKDLHFNFNK